MGQHGGMINDSKEESYCINTTSTKLTALSTNRYRTRTLTRLCRNRPPSLRLSLKMNVRDYYYTIKRLHVRCPFVFLLVLLVVPVALLASA